MSAMKTKAEAFWDGHHHIAEDPDFWMAHPLCRQAINRRVTGDPNIWPLDALATLPIAQHPFRRALSLGCGTGSLERAAMRMKMCVQIEGLDASERSLEVARHRALEEGLQGITYRRRDFNDLRLPRRAYDLVIFHQSLHHVSAMEELLARVGLALTADGLLFLDEWTGPSRDEWSGERLGRLRGLYEELPEPWRRWPELREPIEQDDPSEAVRSSAILPLVRRLFRVEIERPYGGHVVPILLSQMVLDSIPKPDLDNAISRWLAMEDEDIAKDPNLSYHTALVARPRLGLDGIRSRVLMKFDRTREGGGPRERQNLTPPTGDEKRSLAGACGTNRIPKMGFFQLGRRKSDAGQRLHIGCGQEAIPGWINIDNQALPGVDRVLDVRRGLPFRGVSAIFAEHFLEHIRFEDGLAFLKECRRVLADFGVVRISTPNLDWVYVTHYPSWPSGSAEERFRDCFQLNQAFHGWGHQFLYNSSTLEAALKSAGFADVAFQEFGKSDIPDLNGIERHETYVDAPDLPHVLIAEASGKAPEKPLPDQMLKEFREAINIR